MIVKMLAILWGTFVHQVIRRHHVEHIIRWPDGVHGEPVTLRNASRVEGAWVKCECGRLWVLR